MRITFAQLSVAVTVALFMAGAGYSAGRVRARVDAHEKADGHGAAMKKLHQHDVTLERITTVLERLEKRVP